MKIFLAILLGGAFGFVLHRSGAANPVNIINMLTFRDTKILKLILLALALSSGAVFTIQAGFPDVLHWSVKSAYVGVIVGGLIFGIGFALAGYCPGTSLCALGEGRKDALLFVIGGLLGAGGYTLSYGALRDTWLSTSIAGGKVTLADLGSGKYPALLDTLPGVAVSTVLAVGLVLLVWALPKGRRTDSKTPVSEDRPASQPARYRGSHATVCSARIAATERRA